MHERSRLAIASIKPTVFFVRDGNELNQMVDISISNPGSETELLLKVTLGDQETEFPLAGVAHGESTHRVAIRDIRDPMPVRFSLLADSRLRDQKELAWKPGQHWNVHLVLVSHHDLGYTDLPSNVLSEFEGIFDDILRFCRETDEYPEEAKFRYTIEQAWSILHYLNVSPPDVVDEMIRRIKEGRLEVTALIGNQTSEIHGPEELARALYPAFRLKHEYDIPITTAELNDIPGLSWGLSLALVRAGIKYFAPGLPSYFDWGYSVRGFWDDEAVLPHDGPGAFWWEAPTGEKLLVWYGGTGAGGNNDPLLNGLAEWLEKAEGREYPFDVLRYWLMGGMRDNAPARLEFTDTVREWNEKWAYPRLVFSISAMFFEELAKQAGPELRTIRGELPGTDYPIGALSTAHETTVSRNTHDSLLTAERFATIASAVSDYPYPADTLREAYDCILLYDEHTWGQADPAGPAEDANWAQKAEFVYRAAALAHDVTIKSISKIVDEVALDEEGFHVAVFNSLPTERSELVKMELRPTQTCSRPMFIVPRKDGLEGPGLSFSSDVLDRIPVYLPPDLKNGEFDLVDTETGQGVPFQIVRLSGPQDAVPDAARRWALAHMEEHRFYTVLFVAENIPAMGYKTYRIVPKEGKSDFPGGVQTGATTLENTYYRLELDPGTGAINSIFDKELNKELIDPNAPHRLNQVIVRSAKTHEEYPITTVSISCGQSGPICGSLIVTGSINGCPQVTQEITLYSDLKRIDLATRFLKDSTPFQEIFIAFPFQVADPEFKYESALSVIEPLKDQFPGSNTDYYAVQHWANVSDGKSSITLSSPDAAMVEFGGLWPGYVSQAHHGVPTPEYGHPFLKPGELKKGYMYSYVLNSNFRTNFQPAQTGEVLLRYSLTSREGGWANGVARDFGWSACVPMETAYMMGPKDGSLAATHSFCRIDQPNIVLLTLKEAENGDGLILRLWETEGLDSQAVVHLPFLEIESSLTTNLMEEDRGGLRAEGSLVVVPLKAWDVATVRVRGCLKRWL